MTPIEAKIIIEKYHLSIKDLRPNAIVQSSKELPCTSARIKYRGPGGRSSLISLNYYASFTTTISGTANCEKTF
jgi:hypothetical protein